MLQGMQAVCWPSPPIQAFVFQNDLVSAILTHLHTCMAYRSISLLIFDPLVFSTCFGSLLYNDGGIDLWAFFKACRAASTSWSRAGVKCHPEGSFSRAPSQDPRTFCLGRDSQRPSSWHLGPAQGSLNNHSLCPGAAAKHFCSSHRLAAVTPAPGRLFQCPGTLGGKKLFLISSLSLHWHSFHAILLGLLAGPRTEESSAWPSASPPEEAAVC